ncbi:hypothetical protein L198_05044 [Cryptococcus wingfieldii CBS 7118]|uniref:tRNA dimethylallyltransferase n=1 Tax=Cryptococcus wingfieldii CBS 7118 TaxID=1295528 RepID=A0A1E3IZY1_9TREE|nr:hypothetical protein L198_05044 [Cryptococcus wingfieldii CBS 7118]ODN94193.1 hypothetical protein L198_05044 [Cryptococcus wingfieldii CBS 7118]
MPRRTSADHRNVVAVIGTTGVGKSQLAVSLAQSHQRFSKGHSAAVVLSADSMQLYKGLDVITNKVTKEEMGGVEHWGLDVVSPAAGRSWEVGKWCNEADQEIANMPLETLPIVCGGTHYFIQHFLFPPPELSFSREDSDGQGRPLEIRWFPPGPTPPTPENLTPALKRLLESFWLPDPVWPSAELETPSSPSTKAESSKSSRPTVQDEYNLLSLFRLLEAVDPTEAGRWHWKDGRKVRRGLERWWERGGRVNQKNTDVLESEARPPGKDGRHAKFRTLIFWVYEPLVSLRPRLDKRVDKMLENGLLQEIEELRGIAAELFGSDNPVDHTEGIFQSIGKSRSRLQTTIYSQKSCQDTKNPQSHPLFPAMLERTKISTHQYAKSQISWIKKQLLPAVREARSLGGQVEVYVVPGGEKGEKPAVDVLSRFLKEEHLPDASAIGHPDAGELRQSLNARKFCDICSTPNQPYSVIVRDWDAHLKSKIHNRNSRSYDKSDREAWIAEQRAKAEQRRAEKERSREESVQQQEEV